MPEDLDAVRPLIAGTVRWEDDAAIVELGTSEVRVQGEAAALRTILGACDGRSTLAQLQERHGSEVRELLALLLRRGAAVDGEQAWRVLHRQSSVGTALGRPIDEEELVALAGTHFAPEPLPERSVALAAETTAVGALAGRRRSMTLQDAPRAATFEELSALLAAAYAVTQAPGAPASGSLPSAGALYPLVIHVLLREPLGPAEPGLWWHDPRALRLHRLADVPPAVEPLFVPEPSCAALLERGQPIVFISADLRRPSRKYGARAYRYGLMEAGAAMQAAYLVATELGLPMRAIGGIDDAAVHCLLGLPETAVALLALLIGR